MVADIKLQLRLVTTGAEITREILDRCASEINKRVMTGVMRNNLRHLTQALLESYIMSQPEYESLTQDAGVLRTELGLVDATSKLQSLLRIWVRGVDVVATPATVVGNQISGRIVITAIPADFSDVLGSSFAKYTTDKGDVIPWLEWLLTQGDNIIIATHKAVYDPAKAGSSRTGHDIMLPTSGGAGWRIPPEFSGTIDNNFVTRAVNDALPELRTSIEAELRSKL